jgi:hypothetical protein
MRTAANNTTISAVGLADPPPPSDMYPDVQDAARAAAQALDLGHSRRLVYLGGEGGVLAAFLAEWPQLHGVWLGPAEAGPAAGRFLHEHSLSDRIRYVAGTALDDTLTGDLVVASALDADVDSTRQLLVSVDADWLPARGRCLILQREAPHPSCVVCTSTLRRQGLRVASQWVLPQGVQLLACAPGHGPLELLTTAAHRAAQSCPQA